MKLKKKEYESPDMVVSHVEVESTLCSASANVTNSIGTEQGAIQSQSVNTDFNPGFDNSTGTTGFGGGTANVTNGWIDIDNITNN